MTDPIFVEHALDLQAAFARLQALAQRHDVRLAPEEDSSQGTLEKSVGLFGSVRARYRIESTRVEVRVESAPALIGEATLRRLLAEALEEAFGG